MSGKNPYHLDPKRKAMIQPKNDGSKNLTSTVLSATATQTANSGLQGSTDSNKIINTGSAASKRLATSSKASSGILDEFGRSVTVITSEEEIKQTVPKPYIGADKVIKIDDNTFVIETAKDVYFSTTEQVTKQQYISQNVIGLSGLDGESGISGFSGMSGYSGASGTSGTSGYSGMSGTSLTSIPYDVMFAIYELIPANTIIGALLIPRSIGINSSSNSQSLAVVQTPASTTQTTITVQKYVPSTNITTDIGTLTFTVGNRIGSVSLNTTTFNVGDVLQLKTSSVVDAALFGFLSTIVTFYTL